MAQSVSSGCDEGGPIVSINKRAASYRRANCILLQTRNGFCRARRTAGPMLYDANGSKRTREVRGGRSSKRHRQRRCPPFRCNIYPRSKRGTTAELGLATRHSALDGFRVSFRTTRSNYGVWEGNFSRLNFQRTRLYSFIRVLKFPRSRGTDSRAAAERTRTKIAGRWRIVRGASPRQRASAKKSRFFLFFLPLANDPSLFLSLLSDSFLDRPHLRRLIRARRWISIEHAND